MRMRVLLLLCLTGLCWGKSQTIPLINPSFEDDQERVKLANKPWTGNILGWNSDGKATDSGVDTEGSAWVTTVLDGNTYAFLKGKDPTVWQTSDHTLEYGERITLTFDAYNCWSGPEIVGTIYYLDNSGQRIPLVSVTVSDMEGYIPYEGQVSYLVTGDQGEVGQRVGVEFDNPEAVDTYDYSAFDNVRLERETGTLALDPFPVVGAVEIPGKNTVLTWTTGYGISQHDLYLGTDANDVNDASLDQPRAVYWGREDVNSVTIPFLAYHMTYYWRVDEVDAEGAITKGYLWSFTVEPKSLVLTDVTASASSSLAGSGPENLVNGSGLDANDLHGMTVAEMWQSDDGASGPFWVEFAFDKVYKLDQVWVWNFNASLEFLFGYGVEDMTIETSQDGSTWETLGDYEIPQGTSSVDCPATPIALNGALAQYVRFNLSSSWGGVEIYGLSEVRFMFIPTWTRDPVPTCDAVDLATDVTLSWRRGRDAVTHEVYFGADEASVSDGSAMMESVSASSYDVSGLSLGTTYYWRVDAVNEADPMPIWTGSTWDFTTVDYLALDDFENYDDDDEGGNRVFDTWLDGYDDDSNGSQIGHDATPYCEERRVHRGQQAMPLYYGKKKASNSECSLPISDLTDWTAHEISALVLYFRGELDNETGDLYAKINNTRVDYPRSSEDLNKDMYIQWTIDLENLNTDLSAVTELSLGIENGGTGLLYIDDIRLYRETPPVYTSEMWIEAENATQIVSPMDVNDTEDAVAGASGGQYIEVVDDNSGNMPPIDDINTDDDESDDLIEGAGTFTLWLEPGVYQVNAKVLGESGSDNSFWVRFLGTTADESHYWVNDIEGSNHYQEVTDWIEWEFEVSQDWIIVPLTSVRNENALVQFEVETADYYNLEIAFREDGALLDAIMVTQTLD